MCKHLLCTELRNRFDITGENYKSLRKCNVASYVSNVIPTSHVNI